MARAGGEIVMGVEAKADESTSNVMGREKEVLLLLPEEGPWTANWGWIEGEFIGQSEHTRCKITRLRTKAHGMSGHEEAFVCTIE